MLILRRWALLLSMICTTGCGIETTKPLSDPWDSKVDELLYGHWVGETKNGVEACKVHVFVGKLSTKENPESLMEASIVSLIPAENKVGSDPPLFFSVTRIGGSSYASVYGEKGNEEFSLWKTGSYANWKRSEKRICNIVRYRVDGKTLQIWSFTNSKKAKLSADREQAAVDLAKYLQEKGGEELFDYLLLTLEKAD